MQSKMALQMVLICCTTDLSEFLCAVSKSCTMFQLEQNTECTLNNLSWGPYHDGIWTNSALQD